MLSGWVSEVVFEGKWEMILTSTCQLQFIPLTLFVSRLFLFQLEDFLVINSILVESAVEFCL